MRPVLPDSGDQAIQFPEPRRLRFGYDRKRDTLLISLRRPGPALSIDLEDGVWIRFVPATRQIVGFEIEDFEGVFLKKHPDLADAWRHAHHRGWLNFGRVTRPQQFIDAILSYLARALTLHPPQFSFPA